MYQWNPTLAASSAPRRPGANPMMADESADLPPSAVVSSQQQQSLPSANINNNVAGGGGKKHYRSGYQEQQQQQQFCASVAAIPLPIRGMANPPTPVVTVRSSKSDSVTIVRDDCPDSVYVAFFEHGDCSRVTFLDAVISARLRTVSPRFEHCQFVFEWKSGDEYQRTTFSTTKQDPSIFAVVQYKNLNWHALLVRPLVGPEHAIDRQKLFRWVRGAEHTPFNKFAHYWNFIPPTSCCSCFAYDSRGESYFCAEQIATAFKKIRLPTTFGPARPYLCTPDDVYRLLWEADCRPLLIRMPQADSATRLVREPAVAAAREEEDFDSFRGKRRNDSFDELDEIRVVGENNPSCTPSAGSPAAANLSSSKVRFTNQAFFSNNAKPGCMARGAITACGACCGCYCCCHYPESQRTMDELRAASVDARRKKPEQKQMSVDDDHQGADAGERKLKKKKRSSGRRNSP